MGDSRLGRSTCSLRNRSQKRWGFAVGGERWHSTAVRQSLMVGLMKKGSTLIAFGEEVSPAISAADRYCSDRGRGCRTLCEACRALHNIV
jgi:hypothetical protein